jgi:hypothetical protein
MSLEFRIKNLPKVLPVLSAGSLIDYSQKCSLIQPLDGVYVAPRIDPAPRISQAH